MSQIDTILKGQVCRVVDALDAALVESGRGRSTITLVAVSKGHDAHRINQVLSVLDEYEYPYVLGENYVQEYEGKRSQIVSQKPVHMIGPLQSNKIRKALPLFNLIQSVHSTKILRLISQEAERIGCVFPIFIQVNVSADPNKSGWQVGEVEQLFNEIVPSCQGVVVQGLMTITENYEDSSGARDDFRALARLRGALEHVGYHNLSLSMGMSQDFREAILEGATHVRIGTALFGARGGSS
jgi:pyridoxal phosphate enzyme (YggS family)